MFFAVFPITMYTNDFKTVVLLLFAYFLMALHVRCSIQLPLWDQFSIIM